MDITKGFRFFRLTFLVLAVILTTFAVLPVETAEAGWCDLWRYHGCCYPFGQARLQQYRQCCDDWGNCWIETWCTNQMCPV